MPKELERKLKAEARKKGLSGDRADRYVFGTMQKRGLMKKNKRKGVTMDHAAAALSKHMKSGGY